MKQLLVILAAMLLAAAPSTLSADSDNGKGDPHYQPPPVTVTVTVPVPGPQGPAGADGVSIQGPAGADGKNGLDGLSITGPAGPQGIPGQPGPAGVGISSASVDSAGDLIITLTSGEVINAGHVAGATGATGATGARGDAATPLLGPTLPIQPYSNFTPASLPPLVILDHELPITGLDLLAILIALSLGAALALHARNRTAHQ